MKLRQKIILFAITPLLIAFAGIVVAVFYQTTALAKLQRNTVEQAYLASKETELKHYIKLGTAAITHLYNAKHQEINTQQEAKKILSALDFGDDGYFYVYDLHGQNLMHPRQPELVGKNLWTLSDPEGNFTIQNLTAKALTGGGVVRYLWEKPSSHKIVPKLGYVVPLERWGWMLGTCDPIHGALYVAFDLNVNFIQSCIHIIQINAGTKHPAPTFERDDVT